MKKVIFLLVLLILTLQGFTDDTYIPGKAVMYEYPANTDDKQSITWTVDHSQTNERSESCYIKTIQLVKKDTNYYWRISFIPWVIGANTIPTITVNNEVIPSRIIYAAIDKKSLYVPSRKKTIPYDGLYFRLLIEMILLLIIIALIILIISKRKIIINTIMLYITIIVEQYRLLKKIAILEHKHDWKELDYCIRQYCERITKALVHHEHYQENADYIQARSLTAAEIILYTKTPEPFITTLVDLLKVIECARWQKTDEDYSYCCNRAKTLPVLFATHVLRGKD